MSPSPNPQPSIHSPHGIPIVGLALTHTLYDCSTDLGAIKPKSSEHLPALASSHKHPKEGKSWTPESNDFSLPRVALDPSQNHRRPSRSPEGDPPKLSKSTLSKAAPRGVLLKHLRIRPPELDRDTLVFGSPVPLDLKALTGGKKKPTLSRFCGFYSPMSGPLALPRAYRARPLTWSLCMLT